MEILLKAREDNDVADQLTRLSLVEALGYSIESMIGGVRSTSWSGDPHRKIGKKTFNRLALFKTAIDLDAIFILFRSFSIIEISGGCLSNAWRRHKRYRWRYCFRGFLREFVGRIS